MGGYSLRSRQSWQWEGNEIYPWVGTLNTTALSSGLCQQFVLTDRIYPSLGMTQHNHSSPNKTDVFFCEKLFQSEINAIMESDWESIKILVMTEQHTNAQCVYSIVVISTLWWLLYTSPILPSRPPTYNITVLYQSGDVFFPTIYAQRISYICLICFLQIKVVCGRL